MLLCVFIKKTRLEQRTSLHYTGTEELRVLNVFGVPCCGSHQALKKPCVLHWGVLPFSQKSSVCPISTVLASGPVQNLCASAGLGFLIKGTGMMEEKGPSSVCFTSYWMNKNKNGFYIFKRHMLT